MKGRRGLQSLLSAPPLPDPSTMPGAPRHSGIFWALFPVGTLPVWPVSGSFLLRLHQQPLLSLISVFQKGVTISRLLLSLHLFLCLLFRRDFAIKTISRKLTKNYLTLTFLYWFEFYVIYKLHTSFKVMAIKALSIS